MSRLSRIFAGFGLALLAANTGCHNVREEVPPHRRFRNDGKQDSPVEFSTKPHDLPTSANGLIGGVQPNAAPAGNAINSAASPGNAYGNLTTDNKFGSPGTAGLGQPPSLMAPPATSSGGAPLRAPAANEAPSLIPGQNSDAPSPF
jgi:hypothetical protein